MDEHNEQDSLDGVAIIGMAGRFPGADDVEQFWRNLRNGVESVTFFTDAELEAAGISPEVMNHPDYVRSKAILKDAEFFDAGFFGYTPREAAAMDPQHRVFLECAWTALEDSGYAPQSPDNSIGVFAGNSLNTYMLRNLNSDLFRSLDGLELGVSSDKDMLATRVSYKLNLKGPSVVVQAACSTSLVAVCQAAQTLLSYQCDMALAGGSSVKSPRVTGYLYKQGSIVSPDGHCRSFDANAKGTITGEGVGVIVLKRLEDAIADGDTIHAVIKGSALNNDGSLKVGYTAPSVDGQAQVIAMAQAFAGVEADDISYIEAHGTGTELGDPIEIAALTQAFRQTTTRRGYCPVGSVKSNIGHLDAAAGIAGFIKTVLALEHRELPPSLHFKEPNPEIDFANSPFYVNAQLSEWKTDALPRRAGVSSFGIGGTNAHIVLQEAPETAPSGPSRPWQILVLSARTQTALDMAAERMSAHLGAHPEQNFADIAHTLHVGRREFDWRTFAVCRSAADAQAELAAPQRLSRAKTTLHHRPIVFMFTGQGAQYPHMGEGLYRSEEVYREAVDMCCTTLQQRLGLDLKAMLYPSEGNDKEAAERLRETQYTQPALFVTEYALAKLWMSWGVRPESMIGHSIGEYVAACLAGVMAVEDAIVLVALRGRLISKLEGGSMLAVTLSELEVGPLLGERLSLATVNAPQMCVVSGSSPAVDQLEGELRGRGLEPVRLHTSHAFHSKMMDPILSEFGECVAQIKLSPPNQRYISNVSGTWIGAEEATDPQYWVRHLRQAVRFSAGIQLLLEDDSRVFLEVGPGSTLSGLVRQHLAPNASARVINSLHPPREQAEDEAYLLDALGKLWLAGVEVDWKAFNGPERRHRVSLPTYPFERQKYWVEPGSAPIAAAPVLAALEKQSDIKNWLYVPVWKQTLDPADLVQSSSATARWLLFADEVGMADRIAHRLTDQGGTVIVVRVGTDFVCSDDAIFSLDPGNAEHYLSLFSALDAQGGIPTRIVHLWSITGGDESQANLSEQINRYFWSPVCIAKALGRLGTDAPYQITFVSNGVQDVSGEEPLSPLKSMILGPNRVIPQEYSNLKCRSVDVTLQEPGSRLERIMLDDLCSELRTVPTEGVVAYRSGHRWMQTIERAPIEATEGRPARLREHGIYLITGGLGGIGLAVAEYLARTVSARLVLIGRSAMPERSEWDGWLATHSESDKVSRKIRKIRAIEALGARVIVATADVSDRDQMQSVIHQAQQQFGPINGIFHAAGVPAGGIIELKTREAADAILAPKVQGTLLLDELLGKSELDFMVLCSSLTVTVGSAGQVDYVAANVFLDAFAQARSRKEGGNTIAIQWDAWSDAGMAVDTDVPTDLLERRRKDLEAGIRSEEGVEIFRRLLDRSLCQVVVSTRDLFRRFKTDVLPETSAAIEQTASASSSSGHARPSLSTDFVAPRSDLERAVAVVWQDLLGMAEVGIHDNFLELGGHSLLAIQIISRLRKDIVVDLPVNVLFESPTIAEIAEYIEKQRGMASDREKELGEMLNMVENLSDEEVNKLLAERKWEP